MSSIPTSLRIAIGFIIALWIVGLTALAVGAPGEIVLAAAALGTVGALIEWSSHRPERASTVSSTEQLPPVPESQAEPVPQTSLRREH